MKNYHPVITGFFAEQTPTYWEKYLHPTSAPDPKVVSEVKRLEAFLKGVVQKAWDSALLTPTHAAHCGAVFGSFYASNSMSEYINSSLLNGARWLNPEAFLYYSPHTCAGNVVQHLKLQGDAITLLGADASYESLLHASRLISLGRHPLVLCSEFEWATPFAKWMGERIGLSLVPHTATAATLVVEDRAHAIARGATIWADLQVRPKLNPQCNGAGGDFAIPLHTGTLAELGERLLNSDPLPRTFRLGALEFERGV